ncbi:MAG: amidohydrolase [Gammaproteobacteria bacterium]|nr:amidohydrolase [Gammaproteobacteria bacterium]
MKHLRPHHLSRSLSLALVVLLVGISASVRTTAAENKTPSTPMRIYVAKRIITMDASQPFATAVAVADGRIVAVGDLASMRGWMEARPYEIDRGFAEKILVPGLIDNHVHPLLAAMLLNTYWISPHVWEGAGLDVPATRGREAYLTRLREALARESVPREAPFITWGYFEAWHGVIRRAELDRLSPRRPLILWQRSFHEIVANTAALRWLGVDPDSKVSPPDSDIARGVFSERGLLTVLKPLSAWLLSPEHLAKGIARYESIVRQGGVTTIADMGVGGYFGLHEDAAVLRKAFDRPEAPFRVVLVPAPLSILASRGVPAAVEEVERFVATDYGRLRAARHVKLLADGAFFAQYMMMRPPGYTDGHQGKWLMPPEQLEAAAQDFWQRGFQIHVHVNGDAGVAATLDILERLQNQKPRADHRFTLHHVGFATNDQLRRASRQGVVISAQPYYLWALADIYALRGLGGDRAAEMARIGAMIRNGIPTSLHSDFTMAPEAPLVLAWVAVNRVTSEGTLMAPEERISVTDALRAITIDAAFALRMEDEIGSIVAGKSADFTVLEQDPYEVAPMNLKDIPIWGTVYQGRVMD